MIVKNILLWTLIENNISYERRINWIFQSMHKVREGIMNVAEIRSKNTSNQTEEHKKQAELFRKKVENEWFSQSLARLQFGDRKEHKLFQEKEVKTGVFGNKTLAEAAGFTSDYDVDWESEGTEELTKEQISQLKEKYNMEDLTGEDYRNLLKELVNMKVLTQQEAEMQYLYKKMPPCTAMIMPDDGRFYGRDAASSSYLDRVRQEKASAEYVLSMIRQGKCQVAPPGALSSVYAFYMKEQEYNEKIERILWQLQGDSAGTEGILMNKES